MSLFSDTTGHRMRQAAKAHRIMVNEHTGTAHGRGLAERNAGTPSTGAPVSKQPKTLATREMERATMAKTTDHLASDPKVAATEASHKATLATAFTKNNPTFRAHEDAARAHKEAAYLQKFTGNADKAASHEAAAQQHEVAANAATKQPMSGGHAHPDIRTAENAIQHARGSTGQAAGRHLAAAQNHVAKAHTAYDRVLNAQHGGGAANVREAQAAKAQADIRTHTKMAVEAAHRAENATAHDHLVAADKTGQTVRKSVPVPTRDRTSVSSINRADKLGTDAKTHAEIAKGGQPHEVLSKQAAIKTAAANAKPSLAGHSAAARAHDAAAAAQEAAKKGVAVDAHAASPYTAHQNAIAHHTQMAANHRTQAKVVSAHLQALRVHAAHVKKIGPGQRHGADGKFQAGA